MNISFQNCLSTGLKRTVRLSFDLNEPFPEPQVGSKISKEDAEDVECRVIVCGG